LSARQGGLISWLKSDAHPARWGASRTAVAYPPQGGIRRQLV